MEFFYFIITVLSLFIFIKKRGDNLKKFFSKAPRYFSLFIIALFSICFISIDFAHQIFHSNNAHHQCHSIINHPSENDIISITTQDNTPLKDRKKCPYCGVLLKIADITSTESLTLINNFSTCYIVFNTVFSEIQTHHKQIRAPPFLSTKRITT